MTTSLDALLNELERFGKDSDGAHVMSLVSVGNGEFLAVKADQGWSDPT